MKKFRNCFTLDSLDFERKVTASEMKTAISKAELSDIEIRALSVRWHIDEDPCGLLRSKAFVTFEEAGKEMGVAAMTAKKREDIAISKVFRSLLTVSGEARLIYLREIADDKLRASVFLENVRSV